jgi:hypothetical protein
LHIASCSGVKPVSMTGFAGRYFSPETVGFRRRASIASSAVS